MSGHSHAKTVKRTKDANAAIKGKIFSKLARLITLAAREGGALEFNAKLKQAVDEAKKFNMPKDNVEKAITRGTGELYDGQVLEEISYEAFGPSGIALIIEGITDNKNRALSEIKQILTKYNGKLANEGSVRWLFEKKGIVTLASAPKEELEMLAIEAGAEDLSWYQEDNEHYLEIRCKVENLEQVKKVLISQNIEIESASLGWVAKEEVGVEPKDAEICQKMFEELYENDNVQNIYSNLRN